MNDKKSRFQVSMADAGECSELLQNCHCSRSRRVVVAMVSMMRTAVPIEKIVPTVPIVTTVTTVPKVSTVPPVQMVHADRADSADTPTPLFNIFRFTKRITCKLKGQGK